MPPSTNAELPSPEESIAVLNELLRMWHAHDGTAGIPELDGTLLPGLAIHVQVEHIAELTTSAIELLRHHIYLSTAPLIRLSLECAVNAVWWANNPIAVRSSLHESARQSSQLVEAMDSLGSGRQSNTAVLQEILRANAAYASQEARVFQRRCQTIPGGDRLYTYYRALSEAAHGGFPLINEYTEQVQRSVSNPEGLALVQRPHFRHLEFALATQVISFALAFAAWDAVLPSHPDEVELHAIADTIGLGEVVREATASARKRAA